MGFGLSSIRTVRAVLPHTTLRLMVPLQGGLKCLGAGAALSSMTTAKNRSPTPSNKRVHALKDHQTTALKVLQPAAQHWIQTLDDHAQSGRRLDAAERSATAFDPIAGRGCKRFGIRLSGLPLVRYPSLVRICHSTSSMPSRQSTDQRTLTPKQFVKAFA